MGARNVTLSTKMTPAKDHKAESNELVKVTPMAVFGAGSKDN